ncbi:hypothetical protein [Paractinoplanes brasiliensis]|nr:hypothetical protein [Actinoplanes brasiliensis]GID31344.1 hypothetical protein Abr02nite_63270 [Actinoplanes brasiliensis]
MVGKREHLRTAGLLAAAATIALTAGCGGGSGDTDADGGGGNSAFTAYTDCLAANGVTVTMPSRGSGERGGRPSGAPGGFPSGMPRPSGSAWPGGPDGGRLPGGGGMMSKPDDVDDATWQKAQEACSALRPSGRPAGDGQNTAYQNCLKENGVADPSKPDPGDATVQKAIETCQILRPSATPTA